MDGILGQVSSRQLVPINRNILVGTVYWDRLVPEICPIELRRVYIANFCIAFLFLVLLPGNEA